MSAATRRRRDRRGRGPRADVVPPGLPGHRTRAERFDDLVLEAVEHLEERWEAKLREVEFAVEDVPPDLSAAARTIDLDGDPVPLAHSSPAQPGQPARVVLFRRPLEARARDPIDLGDLVFDVLVHEVADLLGVDPEVIDPEGHRPPE